MALVRTRVSMLDPPDWHTLVSDLDARTGLSWKIHGLSSDRSWAQCTLIVTQLNWEIDIARKIDSNVIEVELMPLRWPAVNYHYWQVLAALRARGGTPVNALGEAVDIRFPSWISRKWNEMPWWARYPG